MFTAGTVNLNFDLLGPVSDNFLTSHAKTGGYNHPRYIVELVSVIRPLDKSYTAWLG